MTTHKGQEALVSSPLWLVKLDVPLIILSCILCIFSTFPENCWAEILLAVTKPCHCSAAVIHLPIIAVMKGIMKINNGAVQFHQEQMLNLWNIARAVMSDARKLFFLDAIWKKYCDGGCRGNKTKVHTLWKATTASLLHEISVFLPHPFPTNSVTTAFRLRRPTSTYLCSQSITNLRCEQCYKAVSFLS